MKIELNLVGWLVSHLAVSTAGAEYHTLPGGGGPRDVEERKEGRKEGK